MDYKWVIRVFELKPSIGTWFNSSRDTRKNLLVKPKIHLTTSEKIVWFKNPATSRIFLYWRSQCIVITLSSCRINIESYNQRKLSALFLNILFSTLSQGQVQEILAAAPVDKIQDPYLAIIYITTPDYLKLYNKARAGLLKRDKYELTIYK